ncbi:hypothetical protein CEXT_225031 [Caerostris extrusa]|uniref:Secreted protein n=1 Tax=Caerostris extrusa TaxID=172846 RepID=A0AAV4PQM6_CAEEX|nr:hypothetical protein CEXT_225031 [Caerostris extrusa]
MCSKRSRTLAITSLLLIVEHFKHCPLLSSPLYWHYTVPNGVSMLSKAFWNVLSVMACRSCPESPLWFGNDLFATWFMFGKQENAYWG